jgi:hypothetical protein
LALCKKLNHETEDTGQLILGEPHENEELVQEPVETQHVEQPEQTPVEQAAPTPQESFRELRLKMERYRTGT